MHLDVKKHQYLHTLMLRHRSASQLCVTALHHNKPLRDSVSNPKTLNLQLLPFAVVAVVVAVVVAGFVIQKPAFGGQTKNKQTKLKQHK